MGEKHKLGDDEPRYSFKIILFGDINVGKTSLMLRYTDGTFSETTPTVTDELRVKLINIDGATIKLVIWDTAGQENFRPTFTSSYSKGAHGAIFVYSINDKKTLENVRGWVSNVEGQTSANCCKLLVGNKKDLRAGYATEVTKGEGQALADQLKVTFFETSAKNDSEGIENIFVKLATDIKSQLQDSEIRKPIFIKEDNNSHTICGIKCSIV